MTSLEDFELQLAKEKADREREEESIHRKHRHRDNTLKHKRHERNERDEGVRDRRHQHDAERRHRRHRDGDGEGDHRRKRRREHEGDDESMNEMPHSPALSATTEEKRANKLVRDPWMTAPSALDVDYVHRGEKQRKAPPPEPRRVVHEKELNTGVADNITEGMDYIFGDDGSSWRMIKLNAVYTTAEEGRRPLDEVALERFGSLKAFDDAREEKMELGRRRTYGKGYTGKARPGGELYKERQARESAVIPQEAKAKQYPSTGSDRVPASHPADQNTLNKIKAQLMRAKLRKSPNVAELESQYQAAVKGQQSSTPSDIVIGAMESRHLAGSRGEVQDVTTRRGIERGLVEEKSEMTIDDMVREERRTRTQAGGEGLRLAERIAKDSRFDNDLGYMDENAEKLAKRVHKSSANLKNMAVSEFQKMSRVFDSCPLCHHEEKDEPPIAPVVSLGMRTFLTLATEPEISEGGALIVPTTHHKNLLECDDDEWEEMRNFMKSLTRLYHGRGQEVLFYENAAQPHRYPHAAMIAVPIPYELGDTAPAFFKEAILSQDEEWSQHVKLIDTSKKAREGMGRAAFRRSIAKEMPYFHVWFELDGGLGHVVEDERRWPRGDLFAREVVGGMVDATPDVIKKQGRWRKDGDKARVETFRKGWRKFDWTRVLMEQGP